MNIFLSLYENLHAFCAIPLGQFLGISLNVGKLVGYSGVLLFSGRWFVQVAASHVSSKPVFPRAFWYMSLAGSLLVLFYFVFGKNDSVGIMANLFPFLVAAYNLFLDHNHRKSRG
ncbi:MAG: lipid-A-disaccharide synthase N-terminal domain-containing protein [Chthoniobacterales bacterium]